MATYIVAIKRERRDEASPDWIDILRETPGVEITGTSDASPMTGRITLRATADGIEAVRERMGTYCHVEPVIEHDTSE